MDEGDKYIRDLKDLVRRAKEAGHRWFSGRPPRCQTCRVLLGMLSVRMSPCSRK